VAIIVILEFQDAIERYDRAIGLMPELADQQGRASHVCAATGDGFVVVEHWEARDAYEHYARLLDPVLVECGLTGRRQVLPVHHTM